MICSHDTMTYIRPGSHLMRKFSRFWQTQEIDLDEQYAIGVRMFDIRVFWTGDAWQLCHGAVDFGLSFKTLDDLVTYFLYKDGHIDTLMRLYLEKGSRSDEQRFINEVRQFDLCNKYIRLWRVGIKGDKDWLNGIANNNQHLFELGFKFALDEPWSGNCTELHGSIDFDFKHLFRSIGRLARKSLRKDAIRLNAELMKDKNWQEMCEDKEHLYMIDFVNLHD